MNILKKFSIKEDERDDNVLQGDEEVADDTGNKLTERASDSKLLAEIVRELDINEKTEDEVNEGLVKLMDGLLKDKLHEDKVQTRIDKIISLTCKCRGLANSHGESTYLEPNSRVSPPPVTQNLKSHRTHLLPPLLL